MGILPTKARPTWAGVVLIERGGERVVPWLHALQNSMVMVDGKARRIEFKRLRDGTLAAAHQRRAICNALRAGETIRWRNPHPPGPIARRVEFAIGLTATLAVGSLGIWGGVRALGSDAFGLSAEVPPELTAFIWIGLGLMIVLPLVLSVLGIRGVLAMNRARVVSIDVQSERLTVVRPDRSEAVEATEASSLKQTFAGLAIVTKSGRVPLGQGAASNTIVETWLDIASPGLTAQHDRSEARTMRRAAILLLVGMYAGVLLMCWLERDFGPSDRRERPNVLLALIFVTFFPAMIWWAASQIESRRSASRSRRRGKPRNR